MTCCHREAPQPGAQRVGRAASPHASGRSASLGRVWGGQCPLHTGSPAQRRASSMSLQGGLGHGAEAPCGRRGIGPGAGPARSESPVPGAALAEYHLARLHGDRNHVRPEEGYVPSAAAASSSLRRPIMRGLHGTTQEARGQQTHPWALSQASSGNPRATNRLIP